MRRTLPDSGPWTLDLWVAGTAHNVTPNFDELIPDDAAIVNLAGGDANGDGHDDLLVYHTTEGGTVDAVVLPYSFGSTPAFGTAKEQATRPPVSTDTCRMPFTDVDGDLRADAVRATTLSPDERHGVWIKPPTFDDDPELGRDERVNQLIAFKDDMVTPRYDFIEVEFDVPSGTEVEVLAWHQPDIQQPPLPSPAWSLVYPVQEQFVQIDLPASDPGSPGIFYLELNYVYPDGTMDSFMYPYVPAQPLHGGPGSVLDTHANAGIQPGGTSTDIHGENRNISIVKRPTYYQPLPPPSQPPLG
jgi:hypothetical protein